jgi:ubiquinone/menaquinone biosynthesis C-methylase UbiE
VAAKEFFNERAEGISAAVNTAALCYVSGREQRLWTDPALYDDMMASIGQQLALTKSHSLLEVGCAAGFLAPGLARMVRQYTGVDIAPRAVEVARSLGIANARFEVGDGGRLPWPDETFDRVICYDVFTNFPDFEAVARVLKDMVRVCRRGGKVMAGSLPDEACREAFQKQVQNVGRELDAKYGPAPVVAEQVTLPQRLRRWLTRKVLRIRPDIICFYFRRDDFSSLGRELGLATELNDIHALNPYRCYRFNAVFTK